MIEFISAAALMLLLGYVFFIPALSRKDRGERLSRARLNLILHRQRAEELARESAGPEELERLAAESERNLLGDLETAARAPARARDSGRKLLIATLSILPALAVAGYWMLGRHDLLDQPARRDMAQVEDSIRRLAERLKQQPDDLEGWVLLGRSLQATGQPDKAVGAYETALKLMPESLDLKGLYAQALAEANHGRVAGRPAELTEEILAKNPNHKAGLWMAGVAAAETKDTARAVGYWKRLQSQFPTDSEEARQIGRFIDEVQGVAAAPEATPATGEPGKHIRVKVVLADGLRGKAAPEDTLFIFARAAEGPPMPLAVVRKKAGDLPVEVELDDAMAMVPGRNLSAFERIVVGARVSKSGQPTPSPGDVQGLSEPLVAENGGSYAVTLDRVVGEP